MDFHRRKGKVSIDIHRFDTQGHCFDLVFERGVREELAVPKEGSVGTALCCS